ncbi:hypothetical protein DPEC_G00302990 [Dallia pectoralis]|uniref:Uncharacterized protein n=1 Tax=Dallia pectoralis TaxID=75939 RepID=A0ACC2FH71_DALPE|nr:hypothetical protein DPEC_G00302990 [Dallia pectoralis]
MDALANAFTAVQASINSFREENRASIASLHSILNVYGQRITEVEDGLNEFDKRLSSVEASHTSLAKENDALRERLAYLENYTRRQNLRIVGIPENAEGPRPTEFITKLLIDVLGEDSFVKPPSVDRAHRSLAPKPAVGVNKPRPFIVKLHHFQTKELILRLARQKGLLSFNGSRFHIFPDYSPDVNKRRTAFSKSKKKLHTAKVQFGLYYPATLQFTHNGKRMKFTDPVGALAYINNNVIDDNGCPASRVAENGD